MITMTDEQMTKLCFEAMELFYPKMITKLYNPLKNDKEAMALVKRFMLTVEASGMSDKWRVYNPRYNRMTCAFNADLNRAIVECVAAIQREINDKKPLPSLASLAVNKKSQEATELLRNSQELADRMRGVM
jgi:hypothetical protein